jgi:hypothetical protein
MGDMAADAAAPPDRSDPIWPLPAVRQHLAMAVSVGGEAGLTDNGLVAGHHLDVTDRLCGPPMTSRCALSAAFLRCSIHYWFASREGNATSS